LLFAAMAENAFVFFLAFFLAINVRYTHMQFMPGTPVKWMKPLWRNHHLIIIRMSTKALV
jgi:hypothetical protein